MCPNIFILCFYSQNDPNHYNTLTGQCPKVFVNFGSPKKVEKWQSSDEFGRIKKKKRSFSVCNTVLHLGILRLMPLCIKIHSKKLLFSTQLQQFLRWDLVPRWTTSLYLDYLNYHNSPTHTDRFVTLFRKSPLVTLLPFTP